MPRKTTKVPKVLDPDEEKLLEALQAEVDPQGIIEPFKPFLFPTLMVPPGSPGGNVPNASGGSLDAQEEAQGFPNRPKVRVGDSVNTGLYVIADTHWGTYLSALADVASGASIKASLMARGFIPRLVDRWLDLGGEHLQAGEDTYFGRFTQDVVKAIGIATKDAQMALYFKKPEAYLVRGPGQAAGNEYADKQTELSYTVEQIQQLPLPHYEPETGEYAERQRKAVEVQKKVFQQLKSLGVTPSQMAKSYDEQFG